MKYNYHTHTSRCNHAVGSDEQYILSAIKNNYSGIGITDHIMLPYIKSSYVRGSYELKDDYLKSIRELQKKYENQIEIYVGFECEWDNYYQKYYKSLLDNKEVDYLIFGNHTCYFKKNQEYGLKIRSQKAYLQRYLRNSIKAIRSGLFKIMAHPDMFMSKVKWSLYARKVSHIICKEAKKYNVALELNCGCFINETKQDYFGEVRYRYPYDKFWKIAKKYNNTIVVGIDAHSPSAFESPNLKLMETFIENLKLEVKEKLDIKKQI